MTSALPCRRSALIVVAHPDDESFGLGAVATHLVRQGCVVTVLCLTHGEGSTLHGVAGDLRDIRHAELRLAAEALGIADVRLRAYPDGSVCSVDRGLLREEIRSTIGDVQADLLLTFDTTGVTGHPDHVCTAEATIDAGREMGLPVLGWTIPASVASTLNAELGTAFIGHDADEIDVVLTVDRSPQRRAVSCPPSQAVAGSPMWRRIELLGSFEHLRWLQRGPAAMSAPDVSRIEERVK